MNISDEKLKQILLEPGLINPNKFKLAQKEAKDKKIDLGAVLVNRNLIKDEQLGKLISEELGFPFVNLKKENIEEEIFDLIPELVARSRNVIAYARNERGVKVAMANPEDLETIHLIEKRFGQKALPHYFTKRDLEEALTMYQGSLKDEFKDILKQLRDKSKTREERDEMIVKIVNMLLQYGYKNKASDIHIEPYTKKIMVRFRIDGIMHDVLEISKELSDFILSRIKILSKMRTDEHRASQDGKLRYDAGGETVDVRVSIVPVTQGENVVMRILSSKSRQYSLSDIGLLDDDLKRVERAIKHAHGMVLVTGPTGSGKTTTLYAVLKILNTRQVHISTIEDPVEYDIEGISQIQVNPKTNLTFSNGLRAIVRQDPDVIMVGEIRDRETANIAINSAMTGHLVLSTLHANDAATTLPRLLDMGIESFLVASTVNIAIAQRLVRKICEKCRVSSTLTSEEKKILERNKGSKNILGLKGRDGLKNFYLYKGTGCKVCGGTGYVGRIGIFETLEMTEDIKKLIIKRASSNEIMKAARKNGMTTMFEDGIKKALTGITTIKEVIRVTYE